jgi:hypothetical protein
MQLSPGNGSLPDMIVGRGFYKLGYVTTDRDAAVKVLGDEYGFEQFVPFEPTLSVSTDDGRTGPASLRCAFSAGRDLVIEVMEPVGGLVGIFREPLDGAAGFRLAFHHVGVLVDDFDAATLTMARHGLRPAWRADLPTGMRVSYTRLPLLGHMVELVRYGGDSGAFLARVRGQAGCGVAPSEQQL